MTSGRIEENCFSRMGTVEDVDLNAAAGTELVMYTCPTGKKFLPLCVIAYDFNEAIDEVVITFGKIGGSCDEFLGDQTLTNITAGFANEPLTMQPIPNATPVTGLIINAGESFGMEITTPETTGSGTSCTLSVFGFEYDA